MYYLRTDINNVLKLFDTYMYDQYSFKSNWYKEQVQTLKVPTMKDRTIAGKFLEELKFHHIWYNLAGLQTKFLVPQQPSNSRRLSNEQLQYIDTKYTFRNNHIYLLEICHTLIKHALIFCTHWTIIIIIHDFEVLLTHQYIAVRPPMNRCYRLCSFDGSYQET